MTTYLLRKILFLLVAVIVTCTATAQTGNTFNLNIANGLPTNHVYSTIVDRHGYLWIATDRGVIRYNGYELKVFTTDDGLPVNDVWQLVEDDKGKIWLGSIADKLGYIYNERYYQAHFTDTTYRTIYPINMTFTKGGIRFLTSYVSGDLLPALCIEKNDTILNYSIAAATLKTIPNYKSLSQKSLMIPFINSQGNCFGIFNDTIYQFTIRGNKVLLQQLTKSDSLSELINTHPRLFSGNFLFINDNSNKRSLTAINIFSGKTTKITTDEPIQKLISTSVNHENHLNILTSKSLLEYSLSDSIKYLSKENLRKFVADSNFDLKDLSIFQRDKFWGDCFSINNNDGLNVQLNSKNHLTYQKDIKLINYTFIKNTTRKEGIWWNETSGTACLIDRYLNKKIVSVDINRPSALTTKIGENSFHVGNTNRFYNLDNNNIEQISNNNFPLIKYFTLPDNNSKWICISNFGIQTIDPIIGLKSAIYIDTDRYKNIVYDSLQNAVLAYNQNKLLIYKDKQKHIYTRSQLLQFGVDRIEKIAIDNIFGNIFIKSNNKLSLYNNRKGASRELFSDLNLKECSIEVYSDLLVVYGRFGILLSKIKGQDSLSYPIIYRNIKNTYYNIINGIQVNDSYLLASTDNGVYTLNIPKEEEYNSTEDRANSITYKFICRYQNKIIDIKQIDTIIIDQSDPLLQFDLINPYGNGNIKYLVYTNGKATELNTHEFNLSQLNQKPDNYYKLTITAYDNVWKSSPIDIIIYIRPYWWQTKRMQIVLWITGTLAVILLFALAILITRRLVLNASKKKNLRMEMELKAIYSQINPHFIFNSLNSALLLVSKNQMEDAYTHISKFSRLLRSYIKSSRNKFITVNEEIINLSNYIELQQIRFKNRFSYTINSENLTNRTARIPSLLIQPFVENAIEHGLLNKEDMGQLNINFDMIGDNTLVCTIDDNGVGREEAKKISGLNVSKEESYGNLLIKDLINIFNKYESVNVDISYLDKKAPETGTTVTITIKYENNAK